MILNHGNIARFSIISKEICKFREEIFRIFANFSEKGVFDLHFPLSSVT
jgi:hypothetical protein